VIDLHLNFVNEERVAGCLVTRVTIVPSYLEACLTLAYPSSYTTAASRESMELRAQSSGCAKRGNQAKRREALRAALALSIGAGVLLGSVHAQRDGRPFRIGRLVIGAPENSAALFQAQDEGLREHGFVEGRNVVTIGRWARGSIEELPALAAELVALPVDVIIASTNPSIAAAQRATSTIPIVMVVGVDPVRNGFIESLARPGRNISGLTNDPGQSLQGKVLQLLKELAPAASAIGVLAQQGVGYDRVSLEEAARRLRLDLHYAPEVRQQADIEPAFEAMEAAGAEALYSAGGGILYQQRQTVTELALRHRLPSVFFSSDYVRAGGLASYGTDLRAQYRRSAWYVARILKGAHPTDLPVEQPVRFETAINVKTAKLLQLNVPRSLLLLADEVIE
jgi:putative tryptophan/tyrosine transport system substrate-binding protein